VALVEIGLVEIGLVVVAASVVVIVSVVVVVSIVVTISVVVVTVVGSGSGCVAQAASNRANAQIKSMMRFMARPPQ